MTNTPARPGRPFTVVDEDAILAAYNAGTSMSAIAIDHEVGRDVIRRVVRDAQQRGDAKVLQFPSSHAPVAPDGFVTSAELQARAGITYRQLDYWTRTGYLRPSTEAEPGSGNARFYPAGEIAVGRLVCRFTEAGLTPAAAFPLVRELTETGSTRFAGIRLDLPEEA